MGNTPGIGIRPAIELISAVAARRARNLLAAPNYEARLEAYRQGLEADRNNKDNPTAKPGSS